MLTVARARAGSATIEYLAGDALAIIPALGRFDVVVSVAMFHHVPLESIQVFKDAVAPGGTLILHDLWRVNSMADRALDAIRLPLKLTRLLRVGAPLTHTAAERAAWREHERDDLHLTKGDVRALRDRFFPGAVLHEHFLWRYTLVWQNKPRIGPPN
jgi:SAM-dependent methyltransferase